MQELLSRGTAGSTRYGAQLLLEDFVEAIEIASAGGVRYDELIYVWNWELVFARARSEGPINVIVHALYRP